MLKNPKRSNCVSGSIICYGDIKTIWEIEQKRHFRHFASVSRLDAPGKIMNQLFKDNGITFRSHFFNQYLFGPVN